MRVNVESHVGRACSGWNVELISVECVQSKDVVMRLVALRWTWSLISRHARVPVANCRSRGEKIFSSVTSARRQSSSSRRNVVNDPVPPSAPGWRVRIVHRDGVALRPLWSAAPGERRRDVGSGATHSIEDMLLRDTRARTDIGAGEPEALGTLCRQQSG